MRKTSKKHLSSLRDDVLAGIPRPVPRDFAAIIGALRDFACQRADGRSVEVVYRRFPPSTVSGLLVETDDRVIIAVEESTNPTHQLLIFTHELGHLLMGHCHDHKDADTPALRAAARALGDDFDPSEVVAVLAARTNFGRREEHDAERFAVMLTAALQQHVEQGPSSPAYGLAGRLQSSLGPRGRGLDR
ncbi:ImmA/IrrE family metallo-endopeptidase [Streptomyces sp. NBC_01298]|uniref:ImmA/IrrE family metallo-endopeptidase n=1 Tax=Streptomyces sp. NBC_01298 TaxID=2903817 RepID=UPI002E12642D|nr:ImmA/IrrE family metallo-endopeptidase [Streptomyces sp. NBC_01298]